MKTRVFFAARSPKLDTSDAERYGNKVYLLTEKVRPLDLQETFDTLYETLDLYKYDPKTDFIAVSGQTILVSLLVSAALSQGTSTKFLVYDSVRGKYVDRVLSVWVDEDSEVPF